MRINKFQYFRKRHSGLSKIPLRLIFYFFGFILGMLKTLKELALSLMILNKYRVKCFNL